MTTVSDQRRLRLDVLRRDGDECRYCGVVTNPKATRGSRRQIVYHLNRHAPLTPRNAVVACHGCRVSRTRAQLRPAPAQPYYGVYTSRLLDGDAAIVESRDGMSFKAAGLEISPRRLTGGRASEDPMLGWEVTVPSRRLRPSTSNIWEFQCQNCLSWLLEAEAREVRVSNDEPSVWVCPWCLSAAEARFARGVLADLGGGGRRRCLDDGEIHSGVDVDGDAAASPSGELEQWAASVLATHSSIYGLHEAAASSLLEAVQSAAHEACDLVFRELYRMIGAVVPDGAGHETSSTVDGSEASTSGSGVPVDVSASAVERTVEAGTDSVLSGAPSVSRGRVGGTPAADPAYGSCALNLPSLKNVTGLSVALRAPYAAELVARFAVELGQPIPLPLTDGSRVWLSGLTADNYAITPDQPSPTSKEG